MCSKEVDVTSARSLTVLAFKKSGKNKWIMELIDLLLFKMGYIWSCRKKPGKSSKISRCNSWRGVTHRARSLRKSDTSRSVEGQKEGMEICACKFVNVGIGNQIISYMINTVFLWDILSDI